MATWILEKMSIYRFLVRQKYWSMEFSACIVFCSVFPQTRYCKINLLKTKEDRATYASGLRPIMCDTHVHRPVTSVIMLCWILPTLSLMCLQYIVLLHRRLGATVVASWHSNQSSCPYCFAIKKINSAYVLHGLVHPSVPTVYCILKR